MIKKQNLLKTGATKPPLTYPEKVLQAIQKYDDYLETGLSSQEARVKTAVEMTLTREEVNELLVNSEYFNEASLQFLADVDISYEQYQKMQKVVQKAIEELRQAGFSDEKIKPWATKLIVRITQEYNRCDSIILKHWNKHWPNYIGGPIYNDEKHGAEDKNCIKKRSCSYETLFISPAIKLPVNIVDIQLALHQRMTVLVNLSKFDWDHEEFIKQKIEKEVWRLGRILTRIAKERKRNNILNYEL